MGTIHPLGPHVLVVDNRHDAAISLARLLERWGFQPVVAYDGPSALAVALAHPPAAVLLSIDLPGLDGCEVARRLKGLPWMARALLIALTECGRWEDVRRCHEAGLDLHLHKPYHPEELRRVLGESLAAHPAHKPPPPRTSSRPGGAGALPVPLCPLPPWARGADNALISDECSYRVPAPEA